MGLLYNNTGLTQKEERINMHACTRKEKVFNLQIELMKGVLEFTISS